MEVTIFFDEPWGKDSKKMRGEELVELQEM